MKKIFTLFSMIIFSLSMNAQVFWTENFGTDNNCANQGMLASTYTGTNGAWTVTSTGTNNSDANEWFVSATEAGMGAGNCGDGCLNSSTLNNRSLHLGNVAVPLVSLAADQGASYNAGGLCSSLAICVITNKRAESPVINCTGKSFLTLAFNYMENGQGATDNASLWYYDGATWAMLFDLAKTSFGNCSPQGQWTAYSVAMPLSASNNAGVKIGFSWTNNDDGVGTDPSFAVDDITMYASPAGINAVSPAPLNIFVIDNSTIGVQSVSPYKLISVNDVLGRAVKTEQEGNKIWVYDQKPGIYFVQVEVNGVRMTKKVMLR